MKRLFPWVALAVLLLGIVMIIADIGPTPVWAAGTAVAFVFGLIAVEKPRTAGRR